MNNKPAPQPLARVARNGKRKAHGAAADEQSANGGSSRRSPARDVAFVQVASSELTRDINRDLVLELIRSKQPISRVDLARASGLQPSTVSSIVEQLVAERWIREGAMIKTARGRRPTLLFLNDDLTNTDV